MNTRTKPIVNKTVVLREEFDDWAVLYDPDSGKGFGINPVSAFIWNHLDGSRTVSAIVDLLKNVCDDLPDTAEAEVTEFIRDLEQEGLVGYATT